MRLADGIEARFDEMVVAESLDNGKPEWLAKQVDIPEHLRTCVFLQQHLYIFLSDARYGRQSYQLHSS